MAGALALDWRSVKVKPRDAKRLALAEIDRALGDARDTGGQTRSLNNLRTALSTDAHSAIQGQLSGIADEGVRLRVNELLHALGQ